MNRILIVEDEKAILELIRMNLADAGYVCVCARDGVQAADILEKESFDLILLDIMLPKISGYELMEYIRPMNIPVDFSDGQIGRGGPGEGTEAGGRGLYCEAL